MSFDALIYMAQQMVSVVDSILSNDCIYLGHTPGLIGFQAFLLLLIVYCCFFSRVKNIKLRAYLPSLDIEDQVINLTMYLEAVWTISSWRFNLRGCWYKCCHRVELVYMFSVVTCVACIPL
jgi:hypothetical protein